MRVRGSAVTTAGLPPQIMTVEEAKVFYPLFGLGANVALIFSGRAVKYFSQVLCPACVVRGAAAYFTPQRKGLACSPLKAREEHACVSDMAGLARMPRLLARRGAQQLSMTGHLCCWNLAVAGRAVAPRLLLTYSVPAVALCLPTCRDVRFSCTWCDVRMLSALLLHSTDCLK